MLAVFGPRSLYELVVDVVECELLGVCQAPHQEARRYVGEARPVLFVQALVDFPHQSSFPASSAVAPSWKALQTWVADARAVSQGGPSGDVRRKHVRKRIARVGARVFTLVSLHQPPAQAVVHCALGP